MRRQIHVAFFGIVLSTCAHAPTTTPTPVVGPTIIPLTVHNLTRNEGKEKKIREDVTWTNKAFAPFDIGVAVWSYLEDPVEPKGTKVVVTGGGDRRVLSRLKNDGTLHVFLVDDAKLDEGDGVMKDVSGFATTRNKVKFFVLDANADEGTMAHELGHTLGLEHLDSKANIMCSGNKDDDATFNYGQGQTMREKARGLLQTMWKRR